jgi:hypothetical protein
VTCEEVRPFLPELAEGDLRAAGPVEAHLVSCRSCSADLECYRALLVRLAALRHEVVDPPEGFLGRALALTPASRWRILSRRVATDERVQVAAASLGALLVGAAAVGLLRRRAARRPAPAARSDAA